MSVDFTLKNKTILITGASSGLGKCIAASAAQAGAKVLLVGRNEETLRETADLCEGRGVCVQQDLADLDNLPRFVSGIAKEHGPLAGLVHSAGKYANVPLRAFRISQLEELMKVNLYAGLMLAKGFAIKGNHSDNSSIVFLSSVMGHVAQPGLVSYCATKGAIEQVTKALSLELKSEHIRVNSIAPATINTPMTEQGFKNLGDEERANILRAHPGGFGQPEDVAGAALYLLSDASKFVTGTSLLVDGGYCAQ